MTARFGWAGKALGVLLLLGVARPACIQAQIDVIPGGVQGVTTPQLSPDHWAVEAARRAEGLGLLARPLPFRRGISIEVVAQALEEARGAAAGRGAGIERLAAGWHERFRREYGGLESGGRVDGVRLLGLRSGVLLRSRIGGAAPGFGERPPDRTGAIALEDRFEGAAEAEAVLAWQRLGLVLQPVMGSEGAEISRLDLAAGFGGWTVGVGREVVGYGKTRPGGLVLGGVTALDRLEVRSERPKALAGFFSFLGPSAAQAFITRLDDPRHEREPFLWGSSVSIQPFPRFGVAVHRAAMFGGREYDEPFTLKTVVDMLIGRVRGLGFENQIVSVEGRFRLPTEEVIPLTAYLEWGTEDASGGWWDVPARVVGVETPAVPGLEAVQVGAAFTHMEPHCCGNPPWYRHGAFEGNWTAAERPLGHPLGGEGTEWLTYATLDRPDEGMVLDLQLFRRSRTGQNLYVPGRATSVGGELRGSWRARHAGRVEVEVEGGMGMESGPGWSEQRIELGTNVFF